MMFVIAGSVGHPLMMLSEQPLYLYGVANVL